MNWQQFVTCSAISILTLALWLATVSTCNEAYR